MTMNHWNRLFFAAVLAVAVPAQLFAQAAASDAKSEADDAKVESADEEDAPVMAPPVAGAQGNFGSMTPGWSLEAFGRYAWNGLQATASDTLTVAIGEETASETVTGKRNSSGFGPGAGIRAVRGAFGIEAAWHRVESRDLVPLAINAGDGVLDEFDDPLSPFGDDDVTGTADMVVGQFLYRWLWPGNGRASGFVGVGGGVFRVEEDRTLRFQAREYINEIPEEVRSLLDTGVTTNQNGLLFGGSLGATFRVNRFFIRPRVDAFFGRAVTVDYRFGFNAPDDSLVGAVLGDIGFTLDTSITPRFLLFSVDIGITSE